MTAAPPRRHLGLMTIIAARDAEFSQMLIDTDSVLNVRTVREYFTIDEIRWRVSSGKWQRPCSGVLVTHSGPLSGSQTLRVALLAAGPRAVLGGLTAAWLDGFKGFGDTAPIAERPIHLLAPVGYTRRARLPLPNMSLHYTRVLTERDVHPVREPRRTRMARSLVNAASWRSTDRGAMAILAAGVQQRTTRVGDLRDVLDRIRTLHRRRLMYDILGDIEGGAQALSELDFTRRVVRRFRLPEPSRQVGRRDSRGRQRWIDVVWEKQKVIVEIDGSQHREPLEQWDDMERDNDFNAEGYRVLRFPAWLVRRNPEYVAKKIIAALRASK